MIPGKKPFFNKETFFLGILLNVFMFTNYVSNNEKAIHRFSVSITAKDLIIERPVYKEIKSK